jgi:hypothetical protein
MSLVQLARWLPAARAAARAPVPPSAGAGPPAGVVPRPSAGCRSSLSRRAVLNASAAATRPTTTSLRQFSTRWRLPSPQLRRTRHRGNHDVDPKQACGDLFIGRPRVAPSRPVRCWIEAPHLLLWEDGSSPRELKALHIRTGLEKEVCSSLIHAQGDVPTMLFALVLWTQEHPPRAALELMLQKGWQLVTPSLENLEILA